MKKLDVIDATNGEIVPILEKYEGSLKKTLLITFPRTFQAYRFHFIPSEYWKDMNRQRKFFEDLGNRLEFKDMEDWYHIKQVDIEENGGVTLLEVCIRYSFMRTALPRLCCESYFLCIPRAWLGTLQVYIHCKIPRKLER